MLSPEALAVLGLSSKEDSYSRGSGISQALKAIRTTVDFPPANRDVAAFGSAAEFRLMVASDRATRERAYALAQQVYLECGYVSPTNGKCLVNQYDAHPETLTLLAEDMQGIAAGTVTLIFDSPGKLPSDELYSSEIAALRAQGRFLVEVTRLSIARDYRNSKTLLLRLINLIFIYSVHVRGFTDFVIEVNPRHVDYYRRLLCFDVLGGERACTRVNGAPAVLLRLDLRVYQREVARVGGMGSATRERTLYPHFFPVKDESAVAAFLARNQKPMSLQDANYFGLTPVVTPAVRECATAGKWSADPFRHVHAPVAG